MSFVWRKYIIAFLVDLIVILKPLKSISNSTNSIYEIAEKVDSPVVMISD